MFIIMVYIYMILWDINYSIGECKWLMDVFMVSLGNEPLILLTDMSPISHSSHGWNGMFFLSAQRQMQLWKVKQHAASGTKNMEKTAFLRGTLW